jgi:hypothetical protein
VTVTRKSHRRKGEHQASVVNFVFGDRTYQIDPQRQKVYRRFVEIETSKAFEIYSHWRTREASA